MNIKDTLNEVGCQACIESGQNETPAVEKWTKNSPRVAIYGDVGGPVQTKNIKRKRYFLTMTTDPQRYLNVQILRHGNKTAQRLCAYVVYMNRNCNVVVKQIHTANEKEFINIKELLQNVLQLVIRPRPIVRNQAHLRKR